MPNRSFVDIIKDLFDPIGEAVAGAIRQAPTPKPIPIRTRPNKDRHR